MNKIPKNKKYLFLLISLSLLFSCNEFKDADELNNIVANMPKFSNKSEYSRDSLFISYTIRGYIKNNYDHYNFKFTEQDQKKVNIYVDNIFYSPDNLKLLAFIIQEIPVYTQENPTSLEDPNKEFYYDGNIIVAIRDSVNKIWDTYPASFIMPNSYATYEKVSYILKKFMFKEFKERKGHSFNCNLQEPCFWTDSSTFWRKGNIIPGYYDFQVNTNLYYYKRDKNKYDLSHFLMPEIKIDYPKELLEQYK